MAHTTSAPADLRARSHRAEIVIGNLVAGCPDDLKVMELASILGKTIVPHGSDFSATFGVGRLTEFLEGNENFVLYGNGPRNLRVIRFTSKGRKLELTPVSWPPKLRRDPIPPQHLIPAHHPALKAGQVVINLLRFCHDHSTHLSADINMISRGFHLAFLTPDTTGMEKGDKLLT